MKQFTFALLLLVTGCSTHRLGTVTVAPRPAATNPDNLTARVRYPEIVKDYHVARYIDPNQPLLLHEAHTVYRVEGLASWNLHSASGDLVVPRSLVAPTNAAFVQSPINDAVIAQFNQQHAITRTMIQQAEALNGSLNDFASALSGTRNLVEQNKALREELSNVNTRLDALEALSKRHQVEPTTTDTNNTDNY
jgi:hypothetical protein